MRINEILEEFSYLWRTEDPDWVAARKREWKYLVSHSYKDCSAAERKKYAEYFVYGKNRVREGMFGGVPEYISALARFFLTPMQSEDDVSKFLYSGIFSRGDKYVIMSSHAWSVWRDGEGMPWREQSVRCFVKGVLGDEYTLLKEEGGQDAGRVFSPNPENFCSRYIEKSIESLDGSGNWEFVCLELVDYFVSTLRYAPGHDECQIGGKIDGLFSCIEKNVDTYDRESLKGMLAMTLNERKSEIFDNFKNAISFGVKIEY